MSSEEKNLLPDTVTPQGEYKTKKKYDLHEVTRDKSLQLFNPKEKRAFYFRINKTLYNLAKMHCENEGIDPSFLMETALVQFLKQNKIILCRIYKKPRPMNQEEREFRRKRMKQFNKTLKELRGLRTIIKRSKPKRERKVLNIKSTDDFITGDDQ